MKKALSVLLTAAMAASMMAGCGSSSDGAASGTTTDNGAAAGTESAGGRRRQMARHLRLGGIGPTTGAAAIYGTAVMNGAQIAVDEINAAGGINGYQIAYKFEDDQHEPRNPSMLQLLKGLGYADADGYRYNDSLRGSC